MSCFSCSEDLKREAEIDSKTRTPTDRFWLFIFVVCWIILVTISVWSFTVGHPARIIQGYDSFGNICGQRNKRIDGVNWSGIDMRTRPYVFHMNPANVSFTMKICVKQCADMNITNEADLYKFLLKSGSALYRYDFDLQNAAQFYPDMSSYSLMNGRQTDEAKGFGPTPILPVNKQRPILNRCVTTDRIKLGNSFINNVYSYLKNMEVAHKIVSDIYTSSRNICLAVAFGIGVSIFVTFTIHYLASIVSFIIMLLTTLILIGLTVFSWLVYYDLKNKLNLIPSLEQLDDDIINEKTFFLFSILLTIITIIILVITYFMRERLGLMVALFSETGACLRSLPTLIFQPVWTCAVLILFLGLWTTVFMAIATAENEIVFNSTETRFQLALPARPVDRYNDGQVIFSSRASVRALESVKHKLPSLLTYALVFLVVMLFWSSEFILGCQQMTVASSVATWYFTRDKSTLSCTIGKSISRITGYHLGSIALGSFLITLFKIPRLIITLLEYQLKKYKDTYSCVNCIFKCCQCFWYCMEKFIRYINHNAYTIIAIEGTPYCLSAKVAFNTLATNTLRVITINTMGDFIIFLGKCMVTGSAAGFGIYLIKGDASVHFLAVPVIFVAVVTYLIAHSMLCVYEMIIDTMFLCFVEDINKNGNNPDGYCASESLLKFAQDDIAMARRGTPMIAQELNGVTTQQPKNYDTKSPPPIPNKNNNGNPPPRPIGFAYPNLVESSH